MLRFERLKSSTILDQGFHSSNNSRVVVVSIDTGRGRDKRNQNPGRKYSKSDLCFKVKWAAGILPVGFSMAQFLDRYSRASLARGFSGGMSEPTQRLASHGRYRISEMNAPAARTRNMMAHSMHLDQRSLKIFILRQRRNLTTSISVPL